MNPAEQLADWVKLKHGRQIIKRTAEPYFKHLVAVAEMVKSKTRMGYEIGLCHDLFEDTGTTANELLEALIGFGYTDVDARYIAGCVTELTDVFTSAAYPDLKKAKRKKREAARLATISSGAQTVKYADLIYNINWVLKHDIKHAERYLKKKEILLSNMVSGDSQLRNQVLALIQTSLADL